MKELHLSIVSPEKSIFDGNVKIVTLPGMIGSFSILRPSSCNSTFPLSTTKQWAHARGE